MELTRKLDYYVMAEINLQTKSYNKKKKVNSFQHPILLFTLQSYR